MEIVRIILGFVDIPFSTQITINTGVAHPETCDCDYVIISHNCGLCRKWVCSCHLFECGECKEILCKGCSSEYHDNVCKKCRPPCHICKDDFDHMDECDFCHEWMCTTCATDLIEPPIDLCIECRELVMKKQSLNKVTHYHHKRKRWEMEEI